MPLYETYYVSGVPASRAAPRRGQLLNNDLRSQSDATSLVMDLEREDLAVNSDPPPAHPAHQAVELGAGGAVSARNRELLGLIPASLLVTAGFAGVFIQRSNALSNVSLTYGALFLGLCIAAHVFIRITLPRADPYMFPLVAVLASFGLVMVYRIDPTLARQQAQWFVLGLILFAGTIVVPRLPKARAVPLHDRVRLARAAGAAAAAGHRLPGQRRVPRGAHPRPVRVPAGGVREDRAGHLPGQLPARHAPGAGRGARRVLGVTLPPIKHFGPVVVIWGIAMVILVVLHDIGSSLMFYGGLLAMLYVATGRLSFVVVGLLAFALGAWYLGTHIPHINARVEAWLHPFNPHALQARRSAATRSPTRCSPRRPGGCSDRDSARPR